MISLINKYMNSIILIKNLLNKKSEIEITKHLSNIWNQVWTDTGQLNYANLRLLKTTDKIKNVTNLGIDFNNKIVLDIGCGNGTTLLYLRKNFNIIGTGVDISDNIIKKLQKNIKDSNLSFVLGDHRNLKKISDNKFDIVLSFGVVEHFDEYNLALSEARRVLKPNGHIVLIQPHLFSFGVLQKYYLQIIGKWKFGNQKDFSCFRYRALLQNTGFKNIKFSTKPPYPDMKITKIFDSTLKKFIPFWGHYLYLIAEK